MSSHRKGFKQTGQLGEVMVESSEIAYSYVMSRLPDLSRDAEFFDRHFVHLHVPAGAIPKDGPSAGITMATALISLIQGKPVRQGLAMTGELTLTGRVLPIGGVREKVIAARRSGLVRLIFPEGNRRDYEELPDYLREGPVREFCRPFRRRLPMGAGRVSHDGLSRQSVPEPVYRLGNRFQEGQGGGCQRMTGLKGVAGTFNDMESAKLGIGTLPKAFTL